MFVRMMNTFMVIIFGSSCRAFSFFQGSERPRKAWGKVMGRRPLFMGPVFLFEQKPLPGREVYTRACLRFFC